MKKLVFLSVLVLFAVFVGAQTMDTLFFDGFESGDLSGWLPDVLDPQWHITSDTSRTYDGDSWWSGNEEVGGYADGWLHLLVSPSITLPTTATGSLTLDMMANWSVEPASAGTLSDGTVVDGWDGFNVRISTDGGTTWALLEPTDGYPCSVMYGFIYNIDTLTAGWAGSSSGWVEKTFDLSAYTGQTVNIAFAFASDISYCTVDNPALFGVLLDDIMVSDDADTYFIDNADGDTTEMTLLNLSISTYIPLPQISEIETYEGTYSMFAQNIPNAVYAITTPIIHIDDDFLATVSYEIYRDAPDCEGDGDGYLDDYYLVYVSTDNGLSWNRLIYDWYHDGTDPEWALCEHTSGYNATWEAGLNLYDYRGMDVRIKFLFLFDNNDDGGAGAGFYLDNFAVYGVTGLDYDAGISNILTSPINVDEPATISFEVTGYGVESGTPRVHYALYDSATATEIDSDDLGIVGITFMEMQYVSTNWTPTDEGAYYVIAWTTYGPDENHSNDTCRIDFHVYDDLFAMGYDDGVWDSMSVTLVDTFGDTTVYGPYWAYGQWLAVTDPSDTVVYQDAIGLRLELPDVTSDYSLNSLYFQGIGQGTIAFKLFAFDPIDGPSTSPFAEYEVALPSDFPSSGPPGEVLKYDLTEALPLTDQYFIVAVCGADEDSWVAVTTDYNNVDTMTWFGEYDLSFGFYNFFPQTNYAAPPPVLQAMIRCTISREDGITDKDISSIPSRPILLGNTPNPFNPATEISFELNASQNVKLDILDLSGRVVRTLADGETIQGKHSVIWDGMDKLGNEMPSGIYLYRLNAGTRSITRKMTLVR
ncbi:immune inhibitor A [bacterium]|nr:immune inhibitor A [bacterium]